MRTALHIKFPDHQGKYREFPQFQPFPGLLRPKKSLLFSVVFIEIPYSTEQGILKTEQGIVSSEQGISL
jgi:hypothetical protein